MWKCDNGRSRLMISWRHNCTISPTASVRLEQCWENTQLTTDQLWEEVQTLTRLTMCSQRAQLCHFNDQIKVHLVGFCSTAQTLRWSGKKKKEAVFSSRWRVSTSARCLSVQRRRGLTERKVRVDRADQMWGKRGGTVSPLCLCRVSFIASPVCLCVCFCTDLMFNNPALKCLKLRRTFSHRPKCF